MLPIEPAAGRSKIRCANLPAINEDVFCQFGPIEVRRMVGGNGVFRDGLLDRLPRIQQRCARHDTGPERGVPRGLRRLGTDAQEAAAASA